MITDEQGRKWLLQNLYDNGWKYLVKDDYGNMYLTNEKPSMYGNEGVVMMSGCKKYICASILLLNMLPDLKRNECKSIAEYLGIVDWENVEVDTHVLVKDFEGNKWKKRYFACFKNGKVNTWCGGATSWSSDGYNDTMSWKYAKLAEV